jgi:hypothetical protein
VDESLILLLSDWHAYEIVAPERVYGLNTFNADVLGRRVWRVIHGTRSIVTKLRPAAGGSRGSSSPVTATSSPAPSTKSRSTPTRRT